MNYKLNRILNGDNSILRDCFVELFDSENRDNCSLYVSKLYNIDGIKIGLDNLYYSLKKANVNNSTTKISISYFIECSIRTNIMDFKKFNEISDDVLSGFERLGLEDNLKYIPNSGGLGFKSTIDVFGPIYAQNLYNAINICKIINNYSNHSKLVFSLEINTKEKNIDFICSVVRSINTTKEEYLKNLEKIRSDYNFEILKLYDLDKKDYLEDYKFLNNNPNKEILARLEHNKIKLNI